MEDKELIKVLKKGGIEAKIIRPGEKFGFQCTQCSKCCTGSTLESIILKPLDILNIARSTDEDIIELMERETTSHIGIASGMPVSTIKPVLKDGKATCPFLKVDGNRKGCSINDYKPGICKIYPLGRAAAMSEDGSGIKFKYFLQKEETCLGSSDKYKKDTDLDSFIDNREFRDEILSKDAMLLLKVSEGVSMEHLSALVEIIGSRDIERSLNMFYNEIFRIYYLSLALDKDNIKTNADVTNAYDKMAEDLLAEVENFKSYLDGARQ